MLSFCLQPVRFVAEALTEESSGRQLALGFSMGMVVGLVPKGNLTAVVLMTILCASRVNLGAGLAAAFLFSWAGLVIDPLTHHLGLALLSIDALAPFYTLLSDAPLVPWTRFNNSVVLGSFVLGLCLFYPVFRFTQPLFERNLPRLTARLREFKIVQLLWGAQWASKLKGA